MRMCACVVVSEADDKLAGVCLALACVRFSEIIDCNISFIKFCLLQAKPAMDNMLPLF